MNFFKSNLKEIRLLLILLALFMVSGKVLRWLDPNSSPVDLGWVDVLLSCLLAASLGLFGVWLLLEAGFPTLRDYVNKSDDPNIRNFRQDFMTALPVTHRVWVFIAVFIALLAFVAVCISIA